MNKVLIVIPAYNEEANIENVVRELEDKYPQFDYIVVNDKYESDKPASFYTEDFISRMLEAEMKGLLSMTFVRFFLMDKHEPDYILGSLSFSHISRGSSPSANMGYKIDEYHRNEGLASLMIATALEDIVPDIGLHRTECYIHPDNSTSLHLMEKFGFIDEGIAHSYVRLNGIWQDHRRFVYIS